MSLSNSLGLLGRKVGMMRLFTDDGDAVPVTVVDVSNNRVTQVKTLAHDGYDALKCWRKNPADLAAHALFRRRSACDIAIPFLGFTCTLLSTLRTILR